MPALQPALAGELFSTSFSVAANWDNPGGAWGSYNEKTYTEGGWHFHSSSAVRGTSAESFGGSDYSFRDRDIFSIHNTASVSNMSGFSLQLRDWMLSTGENRNLNVSYDGGSTWETIITINKDWFDAYQVYQEFVHIFPDGPKNFNSEDFHMVIEGGGNTNNGRINIGQFKALGEITVVATPAFNPAGGIYFGSVDVSINCATPDADIYYTLNGTDPTISDFLYSTPINVAEDLTIKARAFADGLEPSEVAEETYLIRTLILEKNFDDESLFSGGWTVYNFIPGANTWTIASFAGNHYAMITEHESSPEYPHSWYISPEINLSGLEEVSLSFYTQAAFREGDALSVVISSDYGGGAPAKSGWNTLEVTLDDHTGAGFGSWTFSGNIDLNDYDGKIHIAFKYESDAGNYGRWHVDDILITGVGEIEVGDEFINLSTESLPSFREVYIAHDSEHIPHGSDVQFYYVEAGGLTEDLQINAGSPLKISLHCTDHFGTTLNLNPSPQGNISSTRIYVRAFPEAEAAFNPQITHTSTGITETLITSVEGISSQIPPGYYSTATGEGEELMLQLHRIIRGHTRPAYNDIWEHFTLTDSKFNGKVWDIFSDVRCEEPPYEYTFFEDQQGDLEAPNEEGHVYNREHSWPRSWWGGGVSPTDTMDTDIYHIYPADRWVNMQRSNFPFGEVSSPTWVSQAGNKRGNNTYGNVYSGFAFEPIDDFKGDFARTYFYMVTRYMSEVADWAAYDMVNNILDGTSWPAFQVWYVDMLLEWHENDPVSQKEIMRNDAIYEIQGNRNPFIDHPELAALIWSDLPEPPPAELCNMDFEEWLNDLPVCWYGDRSNIGQSNVLPYADDPQSGSFAAQLINTGSTHRRFTTHGVPAEEGISYKITFWVKGQGEIRTGLFDERATGSGYAPYNDYVIVDSDSWSEHWQIVEAVNTTNIAEYIFSVRNTGEAGGHILLDNVSIQEYEEITDPIEVANIAALREGEVGGLYHVTGEVILTFQTDNRNQKYLQDATGAILIDDNNGVITTEYNLYDGITGLTGTLGIYQDMLQLVPSLDPGAADSFGNVVEPAEVNLADFDQSYEAMLVRITGVTIDPGAHETFQMATGYQLSDATGTGTLRTQYDDLDYLDQPIPSGPQNITGVVHQRFEDTRLVPRSLDDFEELAEPNLTANPTTLTGFQY
ncbi:MAG: hypothetical protein EA394_03230, partial [Bacteroidia bacterium]